MSPLVTLPHGLVDGTDTAYGSDVLGNDNAIVQVLHALDYQNLGANPNFPGSCISNTPGNRIPTDRLEDDVVTAAKLKDDPTPTHAGAAVGTSDHIADGIVTKDKIVPNDLTAAQLNMTIQVISFNITVWSSMVAVGAGAVNETGSGLSATDFLYLCVDRYTDSGNYKFNARVGWTYGGSGGVVYLGRKNDFVPSPTLPVASTMILGAYISDAQILPATTTFSGNLNIVSIALT